MKTSEINEILSETKPLRQAGWLRAIWNILNGRSS